MDKKEAIKRAKIFSDDLEGIVGQLPMERVVTKHVSFFLDLRADGVTWPQISEFMKSLGVRRKDGKEVPSEQWRAMVSRAKNQTTSFKEQALPLQPKAQNKINKKAKDQPLDLNKQNDRSSKNIRSMMERAAKARNN